MPDPSGGPTPEAVLRGEVGEQPELKIDIEKITPEELRNILDKFEAQAFEVSRGAVEKRKFGVGARLLGGIIGRKNLETAADWMENTHLGKFTKIALKVAGGTVAVTLAGAGGIVLGGLAGAIATPLLYTLGGKKIAESVVETIQEIAPTYIGQRTETGKGGEWQMFGGVARRNEMMALQELKAERINQLRADLLAQAPRRDPADPSKIEGMGGADEFNRALSEYEEFVQNSERTYFAQTDPTTGAAINPELHGRSLGEAREDYAKWSHKWNTAKQIISSVATVGGLGHSLAHHGLMLDFDLDKTKNLVKLAYDQTWQSLPSIIYEKFGNTPTTVFDPHNLANAAFTAKSIVAQLGVALGGLAADAVIGYRAGASMVESKSAATINQNLSKLSTRIGEAPKPRDPNQGVKDMQATVIQNEVWHVNVPGLISGPTIAGNYLIKERNGDQIKVVKLNDRGEPEAQTLNWSISQVQAGSSRLDESLIEYQRKLKEKVQAKVDVFINAHDIKTGREFKLERQLRTNNITLDANKWYQIKDRRSENKLAVVDPDHPEDGEKIIDISGLMAMPEGKLAFRGTAQEAAQAKTAEKISKQSINDAITAEIATRNQNLDQRELFSKIDQNQIYQRSNNTHVWIENIIETPDQKEIQYREVTLTPPDNYQINPSGWDFMSFEYFIKLLPELTKVDYRSLSKQGGQPGGGGQGRHRGGQ